jgi:NADPH-dependent curcumin reductase CurA
MTTNRQWILRERPTGMVGPEHFELVETPIPEPGAGEVLLKTHYLGFDPAMRGWLIRTQLPATSGHWGSDASRLGIRGC